MTRILELTPAGKLMAMAEYTGHPRDTYLLLLGTGMDKLIDPSNALTEAFQAVQT
jgi:hypothetical protein